jgi:hypothetical protein
MWAELSLCKVWAELSLCQVGAGYAGDALVEAALAEGDEGMQQEAMVAAFTAAAAAAAGGEEPGTPVLGLLYCPGAAAGGGAWASVGTGERAVRLWPSPTSGAGPAADGGGVRLLAGHKSAVVAMTCCGRGQLASASARLRRGNFVVIPPHIPFVWRIPIGTANLSDE